MEAETLLTILVFFALVISGELAFLISLALKLLKRNKVAARQAEMVRENDSAARERRGEAGASGRIRQKGESGSGRLRQKNSSEPRVPGLRICPRCYSAISNELSECPACKNPLR